MLNRHRLIMLCAIAATLVISTLPAWSQARYDGEDPDERFSLRLGGYRQIDTETTIRFDSTTLGIGTIIELEDTLNVDDNLTVGRMDGFYRFNARHRLKWAIYRTKREGNVTVSEELQIGDEIFEVGDSVRTEWKAGILNVGWNWSFINVKRYEFWVGAGLNIRDLEVSFVNSLGSQFGQDAEDAAIPLPVIDLGGRFNFTPKTQLNWGYEIFAVEYGDFEGRFQEMIVLLEHNTFKHFGFGGGFTSFNFDLSVEDADFRGEVATNHIGFLAYFKAYF